ncbi:MAG TPA: imidazoleglycerol-phosphate dehydratase HisB [Levilinea sp.]|nr:imidazoleglycerol-phosphate dehydratase HisB [Levilinea sp.]
MTDIQPYPAKRSALVKRKTKETEIELKLALDGCGQYAIDTGLPFFDHMLAQVAVHGLFDIELNARGDLHVDPHHTIEDTGLALGEALRLALGNRAGLVRMASAYCPMDESLARVVVDFSGRPYAVIQVNWTGSQTASIPTTLFEHFLESFAVEARCNLHAELLYGRDDHHKAEAIFKALGRALDAAVQIDPRRASSVPSSKGILF